MQRVKFVLTLAISLVAVGLVLAGVRSSSVWAAVETSTPKPLFADGLPVENLPAAPAQSAVAVAGPVYSRTYVGADFNSNNTDLTSVTVGSGIYALAIPVGGKSFKRTLDLPNGAQITKLTLYAIDNDPTYNVTLGIIQNNPATGSSYTYPVALATSNTVTSPTVQAVSYSPATPMLTIDNSTYAYALRYQPVITGSVHLLIGARVEFTLPTTFVPLISR